MAVGCYEAVPLRKHTRLLSLIFPISHPFYSDHLGFSGVFPWFPQKYSGDIRVVRIKWI